MNPADPARHAAEHVQSTRGFLLQPPRSDLLRVQSRRWFLQTGLTGLAGLSLPSLLERRAQAAAAGEATASGRGGRRWSARRAGREGAAEGRSEKGCSRGVLCRPEGTRNCRGNFDELTRYVTARRRELLAMPAR